METSDGAAELVLTGKSSAILSLRAVVLALGSLGRDREGGTGATPQGDSMELFNRSEGLRRQERILRQAQPLVEAVLAVDFHARPTS
jgi:hypothetical protein